MSTNCERGIRGVVGLVITSSLVCLSLSEFSGQVRSARRGAAVKTEEGGAMVGRRGAVVKGDEGYAAVGRRGAVVKGEEGARAVGRFGGAVVAGEEHFAARGRYGRVVVGDRYEDYEAWRAVAGVGAAIAIGTMLARPPAATTTVVVAGTTYWRYQNTYYARVYSSGTVVYQVVAPPRL